MSNFPLYDTLLKDTSNDDLTTKQKNQFMDFIKDIDDIGSELIYVLITMFYLENGEDKNTFKIPYGGKYVETDLTFNLTDFPFQLRQILFKFVNLHSKNSTLSSKSGDESD
jgi:hypothetical protein